MAAGARLFVPRALHRLFKGFPGAHVMVQRSPGSAAAQEKPELPVPPVEGGRWHGAKVMLYLSQ